MKQPRATILVVEDDPAILGGLMDVLVFNGFFAKGIEEGKSGLKEALTGSYDLILLDVMLPGMDGFSVCKKIREKKPGQGIIMLTAKGAEDDIVTGFSAGADDYITKPFSLRELMVRIEAVLRRMGKRVGDDEIRICGIDFKGKILMAEFKGKSIELTRREMDIITYLNRFKDRIVSKKELLTEVWGYADADIETRTVDIHILKLRKKISGLTGKGPFIITVRGEGYKLADDK